MLTFTLAISYLTTSNLSWFMDLTFQVPMQYWNIVPCFHHQSHPQLAIFLLWLHLFNLSGVISPLISSRVLGTYWPEQFIFQCHIFLPFQIVHRVLKAGILKWFAIPFSSGPHFVRSLPHDPSTWVALHGMVYSFNWVSQGLWSMCLDCLVFSVCGFQSVFPLVEKDKRLMESSW